MPSTEGPSRALQGAAALTEEELKLLNLMARLDGEPPMYDDETEHLSGFHFSSEIEAISAFETTLLMRDAMQIQAPVTDIPDDWIHRIHAFSEQPTSQVRSSPLALPMDWWKSFKDGVLGHPQYWGGGLAAAFALALLVSPPSEQNIEGELGSGVQGIALPGNTVRTNKTKASIPSSQRDKAARTAELMPKPVYEEVITGAKIEAGSSECNSAPEEEAAAVVDDQQSKGP